MKLTHAFVEQEKADLVRLLLAVALIPLIWRLGLGWDGTSLLGGSDASSLELMAYRSILDAGGDWRQRLYLPDVWGGTAGHAAFATTFFYEIWARLELAPTLAYNLTHFLLQILLAFLGIRVATDLAGLWRQSDLNSVPDLAPNSAPKKISFSQSFHSSLRMRASEILPLLIIAFAPWLGWRLGWGHQTMIFGLLAYAALFALFTAALRDRISITLLLVSFLALFNAFTSIGQQILLYTLVFGTPVLLTLISFRDTYRRRLMTVPPLIAMAALAAAWPRFLQMAQYYTGGGGSRGLDARPVVYDYVTGQPHDLLASLPWMREVIDSGREFFFEHETNYAFGPMLLLLLLIPAAKSKKILCGALFSLILILIFALNLTPLSTALLNLIPPLASFRVPLRALLIFCSTLAPLALAGWMYRQPKKSLLLRGSDWFYFLGTTLAAGFLVLLLDGFWSEAFTWSLTAALVIALRLQDQPSFYRFATQPLAGAALFLLFCGSLAAFQERLLPFAPAAALNITPRAEQERLWRHTPALAEPLNRAVLLRHSRIFDSNTGYFLGLSSLSGYWPAPRRFVTLEAALRSEDPSSSIVNFALHPSHPGFAVLQRLYNIQFQFDGSTVEPLQDRSTPAWFGSNVARVDSWQEMAATLQNSVTSTEGPLPSIWILTPDQDRVVLSSTPDCAKANILSISSYRTGTKLVELEYESPASCALVIAMNHMSFLKGTVVSEGGSQETDLFPAYGVLVGAQVPAGRNRLIITTAADERGSRIAPILAGLLFISAIFLTLRPGRSNHEHDKSEA